MKDMKNTFFLERIRFLNNYDPKISLKENIHIIKEQIPDSRYAPLEDKPEEDKENEYPNYCRYPDKAILPTKNKFGLEGVEAIPFDEVENVIYCYYPSPTPNKYTEELSGVFLPSTSTIRFFNEEILSYNVDYFMKKYGQGEDFYIKNFSTIFPIGSVYSFENSKGEKYVAHVTYNDSLRSWVFVGFKNDKNNEYYVQPEFVDRRNKYEKFLDNWGLPLSFTAAILTIILTKGGLGSNATLWAEIFAELGINSALAVREYQKKQNMAALFTLLTGLLPMLKTTKWFRGVSKAQMDELKSRIIQFGLEVDSTPEDYLRFYRSLNDKPDLQKTFGKIFYHDSISKEIFEKELSKIITNSPEIMFKEFQLLLENNPELLKDIKFLEKLWGRELSSNVVILILGVVFSSLFDRELTNEEKSKLQMVYSKIPKKHKKEFLVDLTSKKENFSKLLEGGEVNDKFLD